MYFSYHAKIKRLIHDGHLVGHAFTDNYNGIQPALVLYFDNNRPMPVRKPRWHEYLPFLHDPQTP